MEEHKTSDVQKKGEKKPSAKTIPPSKKPKLPNKLTKENLKKLYIGVQFLGSIAQVSATFRGALSTICTWNMRFRELQDTLSHARAQ